MDAHGQTQEMPRYIQQLYTFTVPSETRYIRTCGWDDSTYKNACYKRSGFGSRQDVCACDTDNCNGAATLQASMMGGLAILLLGSVARM